MINDDASFETKTVTVVRGLEARSIKKWEEDGWELVSSTALPLLRTQLTFRRAKPRKSPLLIIGAGTTIAIVAVIAIAIAALTNGDSGIAAEPLPATTSVSPTRETTRPSTPSPSPEASATSHEPTPSPSTAVSEQPAPDSALAAALELTVKGRAPKTGYDRDEFGSGWVDVDRNGCDTRNDMLQLRLDNLEISGTCKVLAGDLLDPYTGTWIHFEYGGDSEVDIDHMVALSDAWQKGAAQWEFAQRVAFANDPLNLEPVDATANRQKGDGDAATWLPSNKAFRCQYVARQVAVKQKYGVWVTQAEQDAIVKILDTCPDEPLPDPGDQPIIADNTGGPAPSAKTTTAAPAPTSKAAPEPEPEPEPDVDPRYDYCKDLPPGFGPYYRDVDPEYEWYRDADGDGVVCE